MSEIELRQVIVRCDERVSIAESLLSEARFAEIGRLARAELRRGELAEVG